MSGLVSAREHMGCEIKSGQRLGLFVVFILYERHTKNFVFFLKIYHPTNSQHINYGDDATTQATAARVKILRR
jgi:hypothetical protein